jgi:hypothetical protein
MARKDTRQVATGAEKVRLRVKDAAQSNTRQERKRGDENPRHREDFDRLLRGMARSSE